MSRNKQAHGNGPAVAEQPEDATSTEVSDGRSEPAEDVQEGPQPAEERRRLIAVAAYYRAERRGFAPGCEMDDWLEAEAEIQQGDNARSE